jgi:hypothetical protein
MSVDVPSRTPVGRFVIGALIWRPTGRGVAIN